MASKNKGSRGNKQGCVEFEQVTWRDHAYKLPYQKYFFLYYFLGVFS